LERRRIETWGGLVLGLVVTPLFLLVVATAVTALHEGLDTTGKFGVAIAGTRDLAAALDHARARSHDQEFFLGMPMRRMGARTGLEHAHADRQTAQLVRGPIVVGEHTASEHWGR
jgi:hypothetical protein